MNRIVKNYIYNGLYQLFVIIVPLITAPYLARTLGAANLGVYGYVNSSSNLLVNLGLLGIYDYGNRQTAYYRDDKHKTSKMFCEIMLLRLMLTALITVAFLVVAGLSDCKTYFLFYFPWILANCLDCSWLFVGMEDMGSTCLKNFLAKLGGVICIFAFVRTENDLWIYILSLALSVLLANVVVYAQLHKYITFHRVSISKSIKHINGSLQFFFPQMAMLLYMQVDKVMIANIIKDTSYVAFYDQAEKIVQIPLSLITVVSTVMMPRIANEYKKGNKDQVDKYLVLSGSYMLLAAFPLAIGIATIAKEFIPWYLGDEFYPSILAMISLCPIVIANALSGLAGKQYLTATNQMKTLLFSYACTAVINIILNAVLLSTVGWVGAIVATDVSAITCASIQLWHIRKQVHGISVLIKKSASYLLAALVMGAAVYYIGYVKGASPTTTVIQIIVGCIVYFSIMLLTRNKECIDIISYVRGMIFRRKI